MLNNIPRTGAAASRRYAIKNPEKVMQDIRDADPTTDTKRILRIWRKKCELDDDLVDAVWLQAGTNYLASVDRKQRKPKPRTSAQIAAERRQVEVLTKRMGTVNLLDLVMPNDKRLRVCTFAECGAFGSWFKLLATKGKPSEIVGDVLDEGDLRTVFTRKT